MGTVIHDALYIIGYLILVGIIAAILKGADDEADDE
jgi:hypothetical protein